LPVAAPEILDSEAHRALALYRQRSTPNGRFLYYCWSRSRKGPFLIRQFLTFLASATMVLLQDPVMGMIGFVLLVGSDVLDCLWMRRVWGKWRDGIVPDHIVRITKVVGVFPTATISVVTIVMWHLIATGDTSVDLQMQFFGVAYLVGVGLNVGIIWPLVPAIAAAKLAFTIGTFLVILTTVLMRAPSVLGWIVEHAYLMSAIIILVMVADSFLRMVLRSYARNQAAREAILRNQVALTEANMEVANREQQARRLALIAETTNEAIFITDAEGKITWTNAAFTQITGYTHDEVFGRHPNEFMNAPDTDPAAIREIQQSQMTGRKARVEILNRHKNGTDHWINTSITPVFDTDNKLLMCIQVERDVTEERLRSQQLADAIDEAKAAAKAKERFFATMSHEIRTPMNGVMGMAELLSRTQLTEEQRGYLAAITQSGDALLGIINDILDLSKLQSGKVQVADAPFDLVEVVHGVVTLLSPLASAKHISLSAPQAEGAAVWVRGDSGRIRQVLMNLVGNAIKFTAKGGVTVTWSKDEAGLSQIRVQDSGIGIAPDRLEAVFDSFTQADGAITRQFGGTGLGLTICRMLARAMGGDVTVTSVEGQGSVFTFAVPLPRAEVTLTPRPLRKEVPGLAVIDGRKRILVAEDNGTNRLILRKMLEADNVALVEVANGADAVDSYRKSPPDLVVMDMQMPVMDGLTAIREIRAVEHQGGLPRCPILVLSANVFPEDAQAAFDADCDDFLTKPVLRDALLARTSRLLGESVADQALPTARLLA
jgi:two-component system, sensor histidine kinase